MPKVSVVSLGCPKNLVDTDNLLTLLGKEGFVHTQDEAEAEIVFVNTCGFIEDAKRESVEEILKLRHIKSEGKKLLVFGCLAKRYGAQLKKEIPEIDALWGVGEEDKIVEFCKSAVAGRRSPVVGAKYVSPVQSQSPVAGHQSYAYLKIAEGCSRRCTYCVIPSIRGPFRSVAPDVILKKAELHIRSGIKELVLVAQDLGSYGREIRGYKLASLVRDLASVRGDFWIRLLYVNPSSVNDELLTVIAESRKICKYLDIPLQHSEDRMLRLMGRPGTRKSYQRTLERIREAVPGITLRTTLMVGFPGETERDFAGLRDFVEEMEFERLGVFTYSREEGTPASVLKGHVTKKTKEKRRDEIMRIQSGISLKKNMALVGKRFRAIVDEVSEDAVIARLSSQAPEIDGVVIIKQKRNAALRQAQGDNVMVSLPAGQAGLSNHNIRNRRSAVLKAGRFINVKITEAYDYDLKGEAAG